MNKIYLAPTGKLIKNYLDEYKISQKVLSKRTGMTEKHISNVLNGNCRVTEEFALKIEKVIPEIEASYWLNYESKYREHLAREKEYRNLENADLIELSNRFRFNEVFKGLDFTLTEQAIEMLKLLKISSFSQFEVAYENMTAEFMEDGGEKEAIAIWMNLCESEIEIQNQELDDKNFSVKELINQLDKFKLLSSNDDTELTLKSCRKLCNRLGIYLVICEAITNSKVRGALTTYKGLPAIYLSGRFRNHSHKWFAFMHELAHLVLHYNPKETIISMKDKNENYDIKEKEANEFARSIFANKLEYDNFTKVSNFTKESIKTFAKQQDVLPCIIVGFLQHDKKIDFTMFNYL